MDMRPENRPTEARILSDERRASMEHLVRLRGSYGGALAGYLRDDRAVRASLDADRRDRPVPTPAGQAAAQTWFRIFAAMAALSWGRKRP